jgi:hypothetical protein
MISRKWSSQRKVLSGVRRGLRLSIGTIYSTICSRRISTVANLPGERTRPCRVLFLEVNFDDAFRRSWYHDFFQQPAGAHRAVGTVYDLLGLPFGEKASLIGCRGLAPAGGLPPPTMLKRSD